MKEYMLKADGSVMAIDHPIDRVQIDMLMALTGAVSYHWTNTWIAEDGDWCTIYNSNVDDDKEWHTVDELPQIVRMYMLLEV